MNDRLYDKLCDILDDMARKDKLSASDLQIIDWATHAKKSMLAVKDGYSGDYGMSNARKRDSMGRYSGDDGYSRDGRDEYVEHLHALLDKAPDEKTRQSIQRMIRDA